MWLGSRRVALVISLLLGAPAAGRAEEAASLQRMEQQHEDMDYPAAIASGKALLARGGNGPAELQRIHELLGLCMLVTGDEAGATAQFRKLLALRPDYQVGEDVSPKIRKLLTQTLAIWAGRPGLTVVHRPPPSAPLGQELRLEVRVVEDPEQMVHRIKVSYWLPGARDVRTIEAAAARGDRVLQIPLARLRAAAGPLRYTVELLDPDANVLVRLGVPEKLSVALRAEAAPRLAGPGARLELAAQLERLARAQRRKHRRQTLWGGSALGAGLACVVTAGVLYGVGAVQGRDAHDRYSAATTDAEILRYGDDVAAAKDKLTAGHVLVGVGVVAITTSLYLLLTRPRLAPGVARRAARGSLLALQF